jgi:hypothetical protein
MSSFFPTIEMACHIPDAVYGRLPIGYGTWQARRDLNPHHPDLESGALSVRATGLPHGIRLDPPTHLLCLFMNRVLVAETAEFLKLQFIRSILFIFYRGIISSLALCTG